MNIVTKLTHPGSEAFSSAEALATAIAKTMKNDPSFYLFSPDETTSNKLSAVYKASPRAWNLPTKAWDKSLAPSGRVIEMLSENTLFAVMAGHILSGGTAAMTSYEAFFPIISSQLDQHLKFIKQAKDIAWRPDYASANLLSTSCWQRQDHNGYTHQNPALISNLLTKPSNLVNCIFPADDMSALAAWEWMQNDLNHINLMTFNKIATPRWQDYNYARFQLENRGASIFKFISDPRPDFVFCAAGDIATREAINAMAIVRAELPKLKLRFVNISTLSYNAIGSTENKLKQKDFEAYFTPDKPIIALFHGYPITLQSILSRYTDPQRCKVYGYIDEGSTTSPLEELVDNRSSRFDLAIDLFLRLGYRDLAKKYINFINANHLYAQKHGVDQIEL